MREVLLPEAGIPGQDIQLLPLTPAHVSILFLETTGADWTEPHTSNARSRQGLGKQSKD